jgi:hypothetical protein
LAEDKKNGKKGADPLKRVTTRHTKADVKAAQAARKLIKDKLNGRKPV